MVDKRIERIIKRIDKFLKDNPFLYYTESAPLSAVYTAGERAIPLNDLSKRKWKKIEIDEVWGSLFQSAWFKFSGVIPADWKNSEVVALVDTESEGCFFNNEGIPLFGLTSKKGAKNSFYRKAIIPLSHKAKGGEHVEFLVEAAANNTMGAQGEVRLKESRIVVLDRDRWDFYHDLFFLFDLAMHLEKNSIRRISILTGLQEAVDLYEENSAGAFRLAKGKLKDLLKKKAEKSSIKVSAIGHAHLDIGWLWPIEETIRKAARTFSSAVFYMDEYPDYKFGASQPQLYQFVKDNYPSLFTKVKEAVKRKQWEPQGGMWVEPDSNLTGGESLIRQIIYGKRFFREEFNVEVDNVWLVDTFGFSPALPQLLAKSGIRYLVSQKLCWNKTNKFPLHAFFWEGLDGSRVLTHFLPADTYNSTMFPGELIYAANNFSQKDCTDKFLSLFGEGDGGGGPGRHHLEMIKRAADTEGLPRVKMEFARDFFKKLENDRDKFPLWYGELYLEAHRGTLTTRAKIKRYNREAEYLFHNIEFLFSIAAILFGLDYPKDKLEYLWKKLLLNQFHDILAGTTIDLSFRESMHEFDIIRKEGKGLLLSVLNRIFKNSISKKAGINSFILFNTTSFDRNQVVFIPCPDEDCGDIEVNYNWQDSQHYIPVQRTKNGIYIMCRLPAYGFRNYYIREKDAASDTGKTAVSNPETKLKASKYFLENTKIKVVFNTDGTIKRIFDKEEKKEILASKQHGNQLLLFKDTPVDYDAWDIDPDYLKLRPEKAVLVSVSVGEKGPLCVSLIQEYSISNSRIIQEIRLYKESKILEFKTDVDWQEKRKMLKVRFPLNIHTDYASFDIQFGNFRRITRKNTSWEKAKFEVFAHKWADLSEYGYGVSLLNNCKYGYNVDKNIMELTLLRSPVDPDPRTDNGVHAFTYAIFPHNGDFRTGGTIPAGYFLNMQPVFLRIGENKKISESIKRYEGISFFSSDKDSVIVETVKKGENDNSIVLRVYEAYGGKTQAQIKTPFIIDKAWETDLLENEIKELPVKKVDDYYCILIKVKPYEIKTLNLKAVLEIT